MVVNVALDVALASPPLLVGLALTWRLIWPRWKVFGKIVAYVVGVGALSSFLGHWSILLGWLHQSTGLLFHVLFCRKHGFTWYAVEDPVVVGDRTVSGPDGREQLRPVDVLTWKWLGDKGLHESLAVVSSQHSSNSLVESNPLHRFTQRRLRSPHFPQPNPCSRRVLSGVSAVRKALTSITADALRPPAHRTAPVSRPGDLKVVPRAVTGFVTASVSVRNVGSRDGGYGMAIWYRARFRK